MISTSNLNKSLMVFIFLIFQFLVKHTRVRLIQRNEDIFDSYINANFINTSVSRNDQLFIAT